MICTRSTTSGMMKLVSENPCPCAWDTMLMGTPSMLNAMSVPWSASKPRMKYWLALPPPECCTITRPGVTRRMSWTDPMGRRSKSRSRTVNDDAALMGRCASTTVV